jgi:hypothetical protein
VVAGGYGWGRGQTTKEHEMFYIQTVVGVTQLCTSAKSHQIVYFKGVDFTICKLDVNKYDTQTF